MQNIFLDQIKKIRTGERSELVGICGHLTEPEMSGVFNLEQILELKSVFYDYEEDVMYFLNACFQSWVDYSGDLTYPVPLEGLSPMEAYTGIGEKWIGEYGEYRLNLLDHIEKCYIEEFKIEVRS